MTWKELALASVIIPAKLYLLAKIKANWPQIMGFIIRKGVTMEEKVITGGIGTAAQYKVDVDPKGFITISLDAKEDSAGASASLVLKLDVIAVAEILVKHTENSWDDKGLAMLKSALGR